MEEAARSGAPTIRIASNRLGAKAAQKRVADIVGVLLKICRMLFLPEIADDERTENIKTVNRVWAAAFGHDFSGWLRIMLMRAIDETAATTLEGIDAGTAVVAYVRQSERRLLGRPLRRGRRRRAVDAPQRMRVPRPLSRRLGAEQLALGEIVAAWRNERPGNRKGKWALLAELWKRVMTESFGQETFKTLWRRRDGYKACSQSRVGHA